MHKALQKSISPFVIPGCRSEGSQSETGRLTVNASVIEMAGVTDDSITVTLLSNIILIYFQVLNFSAICRV